MNDERPGPGVQIHNLATDEVFAALRSRADGLAADEVEHRLGEVGKNRLEVVVGFRWFKMLLKHFTNFFSLLLDVSAAICFVAEYLQPGENMLVLGLALFGVAVLNGTFAFIQEFRAERAMEELEKFLPQRVTVRRAGAEQEVLSEDLVPGDLLVLREGNKVPADARLVECREMLANNAPLTGESRPQPLTVDAVRGQLVESPNVVFAGCSILRGSGAAVVFATGRGTEFGKIAMLSHKVERPPSPLEREVTRMSRVLTVIAVVMGVTFFLYGLFAGHPLLMNLVFMMGIIVANVPEGLLPTLTLALSMGSLRMARKQVLVKSLEAVEALGAMHVICTDKTGTLTRNELAIADVVDGLWGEELASEPPRRELLRRALIASEIHLADGALRGDPLDVSVAEMYRRDHGSFDEIVLRTGRQFPFDVQKRRQAGLFRDERETVFATKGAWESLRPLIRQIADAREGGSVEATEARLAQADGVVNRLAADGYRVIAVASRRFAQPPASEAKCETLEAELVLDGFLALEDPLRPEVFAAVNSCRRAGIRVLLVTGDHPVTAEAIARRAGIVERVSADERTTLRGDELERLREEELMEHVRRGVVIFARTTPEQKMKIVHAVKRLGLVVGMTGDGVNDAPALKAADVGIAMGIGGTDVAREAADIILLDNNFASIVAGVEEGRAIFRNIQRFTDYVLASNVPEIVPYLLYIVFPVPLAMTIIQILSIDLGSDIVAVIGLGPEPPEPDVMDQPPRPINHGLLTRPLLHAYLFFGVLEAVYSLALFFLVLWLGGWRYGEPLAAAAPLYRSATGITLATVILLQIANLIGRRSVHHSGLDRGVFRNPLIVLGIAIEIVFATALLYWMPLQNVLGTGPVPLFVFGLAWLGVPLIFVCDYGAKRLLRRHRAPQMSKSNST